MFKKQDEVLPAAPPRPLSQRAAEIAGHYEELETKTKQQGRRILELEAEQQGLIERINTLQNLLVKEQARADVMTERYVAMRTHLQNAAAIILDATQAADSAPRFVVPEGSVKQEDLLKQQQPGRIMPVPKPTPRTDRPVHPFTLGEALEGAPSDIIGDSHSK